MKEFQVNEFITLKLEAGKINIYVDGGLFHHCKFLLLNIPIKEISSFEEIDSVDEAAENLSKVMEERLFSWREIEAHEINIPPEVEFWAHCSNLQVWSEYNYDTRLIHSNLAFPLLKRLTEVGDPIAKRVFKEEIAKRLESGYWPVIKFLMEKNYTDYLSREEFLNSVLGVDTQGQKETAFLLQLEDLIGLEFELEKEYEPDYNNFSVKDRHIIEMSINTNSDINKALPLIGGLYSLKILMILSRNLANFPDSFGNLRNLELLHASNNELHTLPKTMKNLKNLTNLNLRRNKFTEFPKVLGNLRLLEELDLSGNRITTIPKEAENLISLKNLNLRNNNFKEFPIVVCESTRLEELDLTNNQLLTIPKDIEKLRSLKTLFLSNNKLRALPDSIKGLDSLSYFNLSNNKLKQLPSFIEKLPNLEFLNIKNNNFKDYTKLISKLKKRGIRVEY